MKNALNYYKKTKDGLPHKNVRKFLELKISPGKAIDIGCGAGRDSIFLIKNNWNVTSIDKENTESFITEKLSKDELKNFRFIQNDFENLTLEKNNLVIANYSIPFCDRNKFHILWEKISTSIEKNRFFCWNFFG